MWTRTVDPRAAPDEPVDISILFERGLPVKLCVGDKKYTDSVELFVALNEVGKKAGIGRIDIVEVRPNNFIWCIVSDHPGYLMLGLGLLQGGESDTISRTAELIFFCLATIHRIEVKGLL